MTMPDFIDKNLDVDEKYSVVWDMLFFAVFMAFFFLPFIAFGADGDVPKISVTIQKNVTVKSEDIKLGEIAEINAPENIAGEISGIVVAPSPKPGRQKNVRSARIKDLLESRFPENKNVDLDIPALIIVSRGSQSVSEETLKDFYVKKVLEMSGGESLDISDFRVRGKNVFPVGEFEIRPQDDSREIRLGNFSLPVDIYVDGSRQGRLTLSGHTGKKTEMLCAVRNILKGSVLTADDIKVGTRDARNGENGNFLTDPALAVGKKVISAVRAGAAISEKNLAVPSMLKKGDKVRLVAKAGLLSLETSGEVLSDAGPGAQVRIKNIDTGKVLTAKVVDSTTVEAVF